MTKTEENKTTNNVTLKVCRNYLSYVHLILVHILTGENFSRRKINCTKICAQFLNLTGRDNQI